MAKSRYRGVTSQPLIAERRFVRDTDGGKALVRLHSPEVAPLGWHEDPRLRWRCGYRLEGVPGVEQLAGVLASDEVYFAEGSDSLGALTHALGDVRAMLEHAREEHATPIRWPIGLRGPRFDGHGLPISLWVVGGSEVERRLMAAVQREWDAYVAEGEGGETDAS